VRFGPQDGFLRDGQWSVRLEKDGFRVRRAVLYEVTGAAEGFGGGDRPVRRCLAPAAVVVIDKHRSRASAGAME